MAVDTAGQRRRHLLHRHKWCRRTTNYLRFAEKSKLNKISIIFSVVVRSFLESQITIKWHTSDVAAAELCACVCIIEMKLDEMKRDCDCETGDRNGTAESERKNGKLKDILNMLKYGDALCQTNYLITLSWQPS